MLVIDSHIHIWRRTMYPDSILRWYLEPLLALGDIYDLSEDKLLDWPMSQVGVEDIVPHMKLAKVDRAVILPLDFGMVEAPKVGVEGLNDYVFEEATRYPEELIPFMGIDPQRGSEALRLVNKYVKQYDARGIKVYPSTGWYPAEDRLTAFWDLVDDLGLIVVTHAGASWGSMDEKYNHPELFAPVLEKYQHLKLVIAHLGGKFRDELFPLLARFDNAYADISALQGWLPSNPEVAISRLQEVASRIPDRAFFGSDWPLFDLAYSYVNWVEFVKERPWGTEEQKERLLGGNFQKLLGH